MSNLLQAAFPAYQRSDASGTPYANATLHVTLASTSDYVSLYQQTASGAIALANPVTADASGNFPLFVPPAVSLKLRIVSAEGAELAVEDNFTFSNALFIPAFDDMDQIRALPGGVFKRARTSRTVFVWTADSTAVDDGDAVLSPTSNPVSGRWIADPEAYSPERNLAPAAADYTLRPDGSSLVAGDNYYNTGAGELRFWSGSAWGNQASSAAASEAAADRAEIAEVAVAADRVAVAADVATVQGSVDAIDYLSGVSYQGLRVFAEEAFVETIFVSEDGNTAFQRTFRKELQVYRNSEWQILVAESEVAELFEQYSKGLRVLADEANMLKVFVNSDGDRVTYITSEGLLGEAASSTGQPAPTTFVAGSTTGFSRPIVSNLTRHSIVVGQSLSVGTGTTASAITTTAENATTSLMIEPVSSGHTLGPIILDGTLVGNDLVPLVSDTRETILPGLARSIADREQTEFGEKFPWIFSACGTGSSSYEQLRPGNVAFDYFVAAVKQAKALVEADGGIYELAHIHIMYGENDSAEDDSAERAAAQTRQWVDELVGTGMSISGQALPPKVTITQTAKAPLTASGDYADLNVGQRDLVDLDERVSYGAPIYHEAINEAAEDGTHPSSTSYRYLGEQIGYWGAFTAVYGSPMPAPKPLKKRRTGIREIQLEFEYEMTLDTSGALVDATGPGLNGIEIDDGGTRVTPSTITFANGASGTQGKTVILTTSADLTGYYQDVLIAATATGSGSMNQTGGRSCLQVADLSFTSQYNAGRTHRLWACHYVI